MSEQDKAAPVEQKPVAWMYDWQIDGEIVRDWVSQDYDEAHSPTMQCHNSRPLYTHPKEWVGLTEEEVHNIEGYDERRILYHFARAIEAKLKEKNT
mgnify:CR=1 FL=1